jgi:hypothetical protein
VETGKRLGARIIHVDAEREGSGSIMDSMIGASHRRVKSRVSGCLDSGGCGGNRWCSGYFDSLSHSCLGLTVSLSHLRQLPTGTY